MSARTWPLELHKMSLKDELQAAGFKGFRFLTRSIRTSGGQKTAIHEFPGSNTRNVEDLGKLADSFTVSAIIHGENYIADVARLKQILSEGGSGDFVHPTQGTFKVKVTTFSLVESDATLGEARFEINFSASTDQIQPIARKSNVAKISRGSEAVKSALTYRITAEYNISPKNGNNFTDAVNQVNEIAGSFIKNARQFAPSTPGLSEFVRSVQDFSSNANSLVKLPNSLANNLFGLFDAFDLIQVTNGTSFTQLTSFFDFGDNDVRNKNNTESLIERTKNRDLLREAVQVGALSDAYREVSLIEFQTVDEIDAASASLDDQFQKTKNNLDEPTKSQLVTLRNDEKKLFDDQRLTASQIIELDLPPLPAIVQAQALYGSDAQERVDQLIEINSTTNTSFIGGENTKVLTA